MGIDGRLYHTKEEAELYEIRNSLVKLINDEWKQGTIVDNLIKNRKEFIRLLSLLE